MSFQDVSNKTDFVALEQEVLQYWRETDAFNRLRWLRAGSNTHFSFLDGPITANNPMGVHHAWGRTYKDLYQRYHAMKGENQRWQNGFDCQGLWVEVEVEKDLGFKSKRDIETYGLDEFVKLCKMRVLNYAAVQTEQSQRLGYWMDWNDPDELRRLARLLHEDARQQITVVGAHGPVTDTVENIVGRLGMPDLGGSYFTFSNENNYQIWAFLKKCDENGWLYKGRDVMPWCTRCGTGISQHEIVTDGYKDVTHDSVFLKFPLRGRENEALLVWTTTPWTLTSNVAAAVGPELTYVRVRQGDWTYYLAQGALKNTLIGDYVVMDTLTGAEMVGWEYEGPFDELPAYTTATSTYTHRVIPWKEVGEEEGTGIVHIAPGCGAEDFALSKEHDLPVVAPLDENGVYVDGFGWLMGRSAHDVADDIFADLRQKGVYYRKQRYAHRYPHCWRCHQELIFRLVDEWFISMGELYDKPRAEVTAAEKQASLRYQIMDVVDEINWYPRFGYDREMDWLRNMHDWMISKKRYWGLALPIWVCDSCDHFTVVGSAEELEERAVEGWETFAGHTPHRPHIDAVKIACSHCGGQATRIADVGNPWLDAGIVAFSTMHYSVDRDAWRAWFPADFITESFPGQFRNWFYSLLAQSTVMTNRAPFKNILGFATLFAEDGREMHKSWGNAIEFNEAANTMGADTMRWLYCGHKPEQNLLFGYTKGDEVRRRFFIPLWNVYSFFVTYANLDGWTPGGAVSPSPVPANAQMDRWIVERLRETTLEVRASLDAYAADRATATLESLLDDLSNWYVRRSRRRFWKGEADADKEAAYATLYHVLRHMTLLLAPFIPFTAEAIYQNLARAHDDAAPLSVHHCLYPTADAAALDHALLDKMSLAITTASLGRAARGAADIKLRQPLAKARVNVGSAQALADLEDLVDVLTDEINVKAIDIVAEVGELVNYKLLPNNRLLGPKLGPLFPQVRAALMRIDPAAAARQLLAGESLPLSVAGETVLLTPEEVLVQTESRGGLAVASDKGVTVAVDTALTPALVQEGYARDLVRAVNTLRRDNGLALDDRVHLVYALPASAAADIAAAFVNFADYVQQETLALSFAPGDAADGFEVKVGDTPVMVAWTVA
ncbi:MAG: isoleucine--tRNA ligase [Anaerolineales bacterium]|nr:isoleucine--tRNA ligase [Anaerolineales bacterium]MCB8953856.1 isoleucine--tRNA ligase [Ardenticatenales bacterium]